MPGNKAKLLDGLLTHWARGVCVNLGTPGRTRGASSGAVMALTIVTQQGPSEISTEEYGGGTLTTTSPVAEIITVLRRQVLNPPLD